MSLNVMQKLIESHHPGRHRHVDHNIIQLPAQRLDAVPDLFSTVLNVTGDRAAAAIVARQGS